MTQEPNRSEKHQLTEAAEVLSALHHENEQGIEKVEELSSAIDNLAQEQAKLSDDLDDLNNDLSILADEDPDMFDDEMLADIEELDAIFNDESPESSKKPHFEKLNYFQGDNWEQLVLNANEYRKRMGISNQNPYLSGLSNLEVHQMAELMVSKYHLSKLDKFDYAFAAIVGGISGLIDVFLVGSITNGNNEMTEDTQGVLGKKTDKFYDNMVIKYANFENKRAGGGKDIENIKQAIAYLEKHHHVSFDARYNSEMYMGEVFGINAGNHHLRNVEHDPSPLGLIFCIIDHLDGKTTFINGNGKFVRVVTSNLDQVGADTLPKAIVNWFGHLMSDVAGSSSSVENGTRGTGLPAPFFELTQLLKFGKFDVDGDKDLAQVFEWMYKQGLDLRAVTAQAIPVLIGEALIRIYWVWKRHFYYGHSWRESIPIANTPDLQKLLLAMVATFETIDVTGAAINRGPTWAMLFDLNYVGLVDLTFRSMQVVRSQIRQVKELDKMDEDLNAELERVCADM